MDLLAKENEGLMLEKMSMKNRHEEQSKKIVEIRDINSNYKDELSEKARLMRDELERLAQDNSQLTGVLRELEARTFAEKEQWVEERSRLIEEIASGKVTLSQKEVEGTVAEEMDRLRKENRDLKELLEAGGGGEGDNRVLLERLENYRIRL